MVYENKQIIFLLDDEESVLTLFKDYFERKLPDVDVYCFSKYKDFIEHPLLTKASLFIYDIQLKEILTGDQIAYEISKINSAPVLFISGKEYNFESFNDSCITYDFISKPINFSAVINRVKVLLKVSKTYECLYDEQEQLKLSLKEIFDYTNIYLLILDENMIIKLCSFKLMKDLGYEDICEIEGKSWRDFIKTDDKEKIMKIHQHVLDADKVYQKTLREVTTTILTNHNTEISVKWFNSRILNSHTYTFSIGIPYNRTVSADDSIDSIRAYWKHVIDQNNTTLKAIKSTIKENK